MLRSLVLAAILGGTLAGCASGPSPMMMSAPAPMMATESLVWVRTDGQSGRTNPGLASLFATDRSLCGVSAASDNAALRAAEPCMNGRGYVLVPASQAEATAASFRSQAAGGQLPSG